LLLKDSLLVITGQVSHDDYSGALKMRAEGIRPLSDVRQERARELCLALDAGVLPANFARQLGELLDPYREGRCPIVIDYSRSDARAQLRLGPSWQVRPEDDLLQRLRDTYGPESVRLVY